MHKLTVTDNFCGGFVRIISIECFKSILQVILGRKHVFLYKMCEGQGIIHLLNIIMKNETENPFVYVHCVYEFLTWVLVKVIPSI